MFSVPALAVECAAGRGSAATGIIHSDWVGQYVANTCKVLLRHAQAQLSHSRRGECYDNALPGTTQAESLWWRRKTEELEARDWPVFTDLAGAQASVTTCFDY